MKQTEVKTHRRSRSGNGKNDWYDIWAKRTTNITEKWKIKNFCWISGLGGKKAKNRSYFAIFDHYFSVFWSKTNPTSSCCWVNIRSYSCHILPYSTLILLFRHISLEIWLSFVIWGSAASVQDALPFCAICFSWQTVFQCDLTLGQFCIELSRVWVRFVYTRSDACALIFHPYFFIFAPKFFFLCFTNLSRFILFS